jgi:hypothetical protein
MWVVFKLQLGSSSSGAYRILSLRVNGNSRRYLATKCGINPIRTSVPSGGVSCNFVLDVIYIYDARGLQLLVSQQKKLNERNINKIK